MITSNCAPRFNSPRQLVHRLAYGQTEAFQAPPINSLIERGADLGAGQPKLDVTLLVAHEVLDKREPGVRRRRTRGSVP